MLRSIQLTYCTSNFVGKCIKGRNDDIADFWRTGLYSTKGEVRFKLMQLYILYSLFQGLLSVPIISGSDLIAATSFKMCVDKYKDLVKVTRLSPIDPL